MTFFCYLYFDALHGLMVVFFIYQAAFLSILEEFEPLHELAKRVKLFWRALLGLLIKDAQHVLLDINYVLVFLRIDEQLKVVCHILLGVYECDRAVVCLGTGSHGDLGGGLMSLRAMPTFMLVALADATL